MVATGHEHRVTEVFDSVYTPIDVDSQAPFLEQKKVMFSILSMTWKESSAASLYNMYAMEGKTNYGNAQLIWRDLVTLFMSGQAGKSLQ